MTDILLNRFLEYYDMSAYYNLLVAKGINCLEDLLNATKQVFKKIYDFKLKPSIWISL